MLQLPSVLYHGIDRVIFALFTGFNALRKNGLKFRAITILLVGVITCSEAAAANEKKPLSHATTPSDDESSQTSFQSVQALEKQVANYLKQKADQKLFNLRIQVRPISQNLNLGRCKSPVELKDTRPEKRLGRMTIMLECSDPAWRIYATAEIEGDLKVVQTTRPIVKNATLTPSDLETVLVHYKRADQRAVHAIKNAVGMRAKRAIPAHQTLTVNLLQPPYLVFENRPIKLITDFNGLQVQTSGTALEDGIKGARVRVKNNRSEKILIGIVVAPNTVEIP